MISEILSFDPLLLARIQFAFTIGFHIIFPAFTIGLASFLAVIEWRWLKTGNKHYYDIYKFWVKIFSVTFGMGVVSGVTMSYQFGTNWSIFADKTANVLGPLLSFEVLTAFFLESSFLGIMLFGWKKVSQKMHFTATCIVAIGTLISAFWILSANSWMQTPQGYEIGVNGQIYPVNWLEIIFNPSFPFRLIHMVTAAYLTTAFVIGGVGAFYLWRKVFIPQARIMLGMATIMAALVAPLQIFFGDLHGLNTLKYQPLKIAAIEGIWETEKSASLRIFAIPDQEKEMNHYSLEIPKLGSLILTHDINGELKGLKEWKKEDRPPVILVFWSFRIMVTVGILMALTGLISAFAYFRKKLFNTNWLHIWWMLMMPSGFIAIISGWFVTEIGRQPYVVYGIIRTSQAMSPAILGGQVAWSLITFIIIYILIFGAGSYYILRLIFNGIPAIDDKDQYYKPTMEAAILKNSKNGENNV